MSPIEGPESNSTESNLGLMRGLVLAGFALSSLLILATFNRHSATRTPHKNLASQAVAVSAPAQTLPSGATISAASPKAAMRFARLPVDFEVNRGQVDSRAKYIARGTGYSLFLTGDGAVLTLDRFKTRFKRTALTPNHSILFQSRQLGDIPVDRRDRRIGRLVLELSIVRDRCDIYLALRSGGHRMR